MKVRLAERCCQKYFTTRNNSRCNRETISVMKWLAYDNTSSVRINFHNKFCDLPQKDKTLTTLIHKSLSKSLKAPWKKINKSATIGISNNVVDTETTTNIKFAILFVNYKRFSTCQQPWKLAHKSNMHKFFMPLYILYYVPLTGKFPMYSYLIS